MPQTQAYFRQHRPRLLATWGRHDPALSPAGAKAYKPDLPDAEMHLLDAGHFALETHAGEIAALIHDFLGRVLSMGMLAAPRLLDPLLQKVGQRHESLVFAHPGKGRGVTKRDRGHSP